MNGCELKKCTSYGHGKCWYDGDICKYHRIDCLIDGTIKDEVTDKIVERVLLEFSAFLHTLPELQNGHDVGMVEVGYSDEGKLNYGPFWLSRNETDAIVKQFLAQRTAVASNNVINPTTK